jgi:predicted DNA-binding protein
MMHMTTKHRRITISLPPEVDVALAAMAKAENRPQAKIVTEVLTEVAPMMLSMAKLHEQIKAGKKVDAKRTIQHMFGDQMATLFSEQGEFFKGKAK